MGGRGKAITKAVSVRLLRDKWGVGGLGVAVTIQFTEEGMVFWLETLCCEGCLSSL